MYFGLVMIPGKYLAKVLMWVNQYRSSIFTNGTESRMAAMSEEKEQTRSRSSIMTTQIQQLEAFYLADPEHQEFELKQNHFLLQLIGNLSEEELETWRMATKLNGYLAELSPSRTQRRINQRLMRILRKPDPFWVNCSEPLGKKL